MFDNTISPVLGGSGGGGSAVPFVPSVSPFTDEAGRDTWGAANLDQLFNNTNKFTQIEVGVESERWGGEDMPSTYDATKWIPASVGDTAGTIRNKLESLAGDNRLDATAIKDLDVSAKGLLLKSTRLHKQKSFRMVIHFQKAELTISLSKSGYRLAFLLCQLDKNRFTTAQAVALVSLVAMVTIQQIQHRH